MTIYDYVAVDRLGKEKKGSMEGETPEKVGARLKIEGLIPVSIKEQTLLSRDIEIPFLKRKIKPRDMSVFCRQFVSIIGAGVTIVDALQMLFEQTENVRLKNAIRETKVGIEKGESLADSMRPHEDVYTPMLITLVEAGEASGSLDISFTRMAEQYEKDAKLKSMMRKSMIYPAIVGVVSIAVIIVLLTVVVPNFMSMFSQIDGEMPALTLAIVAMSDFTGKFWYIILLVVLAIIIGFHYFGKTEQGKYFFGKIAIKLPLFGKLNVKIASARFARTMSTLTAAGLNMIDSLEISANSMTNIYFKDALMKAKDDVSQGTPLSQPLQESGLFPPMVYHMTGIGEETGNLDEMLRKLADYYDEEVEITAQSVMAAVEPLIIVVLAVIVLIVLLAVFLPMVNLYEALDNI